MVSGRWRGHLAKMLKKGLHATVERDGGLTGLVPGEVRAEKASGGQGETQPGAVGRVAQRTQVEVG